MADLTTADTEGYALGRLDQGAANATVNRELAALKRCFTLAVRAEAGPQAAYPDARGKQRANRILRA
jgi:hypothetical protein